MFQLYPNREVNLKVYPNGVPKVLPDEVTLQDVIQSMPKEVFQKDMAKAWKTVVITLLSVALAEYLIYISPWYLLPLAWAFAGTAFTGFFVIGHDCGHLSFARSHLVNDIVGTLAFLPMFYPFEPWRIKHNFHHSNTNKLHVDNAWQPFQADYYYNAPVFERFIMRIIKGPFWYLASIGHQIKEHFFLENFTPEQRPRVKVSLTCVYIAAAIFFPTMLYNVGLWGLVKYWILPFIGYHFWMSTFTMVHHTLPHIPFLPDGKWTDVRARLTLTVHCEYPAWIEYLTHSINVHVPHHVSTGIPSYNLRKAHEALKAKWGKYMHESVFGYELIKDIITTCHLYDPQECYTPFDSHANTEQFKVKKDQ